MTQKMNKFNSLKKTTKVDFATYLGVIVVFIITTILQNNGSLKRSAIGLLVPICCYMSMAVSLNLTVGILGELSLGHAGFMSVGAFSGIVGCDRHRHDRNVHRGLHPRDDHAHRRAEPDSFARGPRDHGHP